MNLMDNPRSFSVWDYIVFSSVLAISAAIGLYHGCIRSRQRTTAEFLMANKQMGVLPIALSMLASFMSAVTVLGLPAEVYVHGTQFMFISVAYLFMMPLVAFGFFPVFHRLDLTSAYEYFELRFKSKLLRAIGSGAFIIQMVLYLAVVLYGPCLALNAVTGLNLWASVFSVGIVCTFYTSLGGMKAVMWTDVFQVGLMIGGLLAVLIKGSVDFGGFQAIWDIAREGQRIEFFNVDPHPSARHTVWTLAIGGLFQWLTLYINQTQVQRALTARSIQVFQIATLINGPGLVFINIIASLCGLVAYAYFQHCDPITNGEIFASDQILPFYIMSSFNVPGLPGLYVAAVFSGSLSTISSGVNSLSAVTMQDFVRGYCFPNLGENTATKVAKFLAMSYGILVIVLTVVVSQMGAILQAAFTLTGLVGGPLLGMFCLGMLFRHASWKGALTGWISATLLVSWIAIGANLVTNEVWSPPRSTDGCPTAFSNSTVEVENETVSNLYDTTYADTYTESTTQLNSQTKDSRKPLFFGLYTISYLWYPMVGTVTTVIVGCLVSWCTGCQKKEHVDDRTLMHLSQFGSCCRQKQEACSIKAQPDIELKNASNKLSTNMQLLHLEKDVYCAVPQTEHKSPD